MPSSSRAAIAAVALALAGCGTEVVQGTAAPAATESAEPFDSIGDPEELTDLERGTIVASALDPDGEPVFLAVIETSEYLPLTLLRRSGSEWETTTLDDQTYRTYHADMGVTADGTVVVVGYAEPGCVITRITPDGEVSTVPLAGDVDNERLLMNEAVVAPAGDVVYLTFQEEDENGDDMTDVRHLLAVDPVTGDIRGEQSVPTSSGEIERVVPAVTPAGDLLLAINYDLDGSGTGDVTTLASYHADLEVFGDVTLVDDGVPVTPWSVEVDDDGTAYLTVVTGTDEEETHVDLRILSVEDGATTATELFSTPFPSGLDTATVDAAGGWLYLVGPEDGPNSVRQVTAVDMRSGEAAEPLPLCAGLYVTELLLTDDGTRALMTIRCVDDLSPVLITLS